MLLPLGLGMAGFDHGLFNTGWDLPPGQVADSPVDQLGAPARRPLREVAGLEQQRTIPARRRIHRRAQPGRATADDHDVPGAAGADSCQNRALGKFDVLNYRGGLSNTRERTGFVIAGRGGTMSIAASYSREMKPAIELRFAKPNAGERSFGVTIVHRFHGLKPCQVGIRRSPSAAHALLARGIVRMVN